MQDAMPARVVMLLSDVCVAQNVSICFAANTLPCRRVVWSKFCLKFFDVLIEQITSQVDLILNPPSILSSISQDFSEDNCRECGIATVLHSLKKTQVIISVPVLIRVI